MGGESGCEGEEMATKESVPPLVTARSSRQGFHLCLALRRVRHLSWGLHWGHSRRHWIHRQARLALDGIR